MADYESDHHHYWPDGLIPLTPQARRFGYEMDVYITKTVWDDCILWPRTPKIDTNPDKRIFEVLQSCFEGMSRALATADDRVSFTFKHWYWRKQKPNAKKQAKTKLGARLCLHPETEEPWLLIFDITRDGISDLKKGDKPDVREETDAVGEHRADESVPGEVRGGPGSAVDQGD